MLPLLKPRGQQGLGRYAVLSQLHWFAVDISEGVGGMLALVLPTVQGGFCYLQATSTWKIESSLRFFKGLSTHMNDNNSDYEPHMQQQCCERCVHKYVSPTDKGADHCHCTTKQAQCA